MEDELTIAVSEGDEDVYHVRRWNGDFVGWIIIENGASGFNQESSGEILLTKDLFAIASFMRKLDLSLTTL